MVKLIIPSPLRKFTNNQKSFESKASSVKEAINQLVVKFGGLKQHILDKDDNIRSFVRIYVGDNDIKYLQGDQTPLKDGDLISIIPTILGHAI